MSDTSVGDVYVDVGADTTTLEAKLKAKLDELSKKLQAKVAIAIQTATASAALDSWVSDKSATKSISLLARVKTALADIDLTGWLDLQSQRVIDISVKISKTSLANVATQLQGLTGLSAVSAEFSQFSGFLAAFVQGIPQVGQTTLMIASAANIALDALGGLGSTLNYLVPAFAGVAAAGVAIPGILASAGASAAVLVLAIKNAPPAVKEALDSYKSLKTGIVDNFWAAAKGNVVDFFTSMRGQAKSGFDEISKGLGTFVGSFVKDLQGTLGGGVLQGMFDNMEKGFAALAPAAAPFAQILANLGTFGTSLLPGISGWISKIAADFNTWLANGIKTGSLNTDLVNLEVILKTVWGAAQGLFSVFTGIGKAAQAANIGQMLTPLTAIGKIVNSPGFQSALTTFFNGAKVGATGLFSALKPIGDMLTALAPSISGFLAGAGIAIGSLLSNLAKSLSGPVFQKGLATFFQGVLGLVQPLIAVMPIFADKLALIGTLGGDLLKTLGPVFATMLQTLVPAFGNILKAVQPLIAEMGPALMGVVQSLGPVITTLIKDAFDPFVDVLKILVPLVAPLLKALTPFTGVILGVAAGVLVAVKAYQAWQAISAIVKTAQDGMALATYGMAAANGASGASAVIAKGIILAQAAASKVAQGATIAATVATKAWGAAQKVGALATAAATAVQDAATVSFDGSKTSIIGYLASMVAAKVAMVASTVATGAATAAQWLLNVALDANPIGIIILAIAALVAGLIWFFTQTKLGKELWKDFTDFLVSAWNNVSKWFTDVWNTMVKANELAIKLIDTTIRNVVNAIVTWWNAVWKGISDFFTTVFNGIVYFITNWSLPALIVKAIQWVSDNWNAIWKNIGDFFSSIWNAMVDGVKIELGWISSFINGALKDINDAWNGMWNGLGDVVSGIWKSITGFIRSGINDVIGLINSFIAGLNTVGKGISTLTKGAITVHVAPIPKLAAGATINPTAGGTLAILGEGGKSESVVDTGMMNSLLDVILNSFPAAVSALRTAVNPSSAAAASTAVAGEGPSITNNMFVPDSPDPKVVAQEFVNRLAEQVGLK